MEISKPWLRALSGLSINFSAASFGFAFLGSTLSLPKKPDELIALTFNFLLGILFLALTVKFEEKLEK